MKLLTFNARAALSRLIAAALSLCAMQTAVARDNNDETTFTVCALNVDGLPNKISNVTINADGKGADGATAIGQYLSAKGYDVVAVSEDFNYHNNLVAALAGTYNIGKWRGGVDATAAVTAADTDGLCLFTRMPVAFSAEQWTRWNQCYGKFTNGSDELIRKGYRHYTVALASGTLVDFYIMHMDADVSAQDIAARASQWTQLCEAVMANRSGHPIIVMGDTNSRYTRDEVNRLFADPVTADGRYTVTDAWVALCRAGECPTYGSDALVVPDDKKTSSAAYADYEIVDKVFCLNPTAQGAAHITPKAIQFDADGYTGADGQLMGDHVPVVVTMSVQAATADGYSTYTPAEASEWWRGETIEDGKQAYIYNVGMKYFITSDAKPVVKNIANALMWTMRKQTNGYTIDSGIYRLYMDKVLKWTAGIKQNSGATTFTVQESNGDGQSSGAYKFVYTKRSDTRYLNIDNGNLNYTAAKTQGPANDWLLVSAGQKQAYAEYQRLYTQANAYVGNAALTPALEQELESTLTATATSCYTTSAADNAKLAALVAKLQQQLPTAISKPLLPVSTAKPAAIYTIDGRRIPTMQRGLNIVRMTDGTTRKVVLR